MNQIITGILNKIDEALKQNNVILTNEQLYGMWDSVVEQADGWIDEPDEAREKQYVDTWCIVEYNNEKYNIFIDLEVKGCYYKNRQLLEENMIITHIWLAPDKTSKSPELIYERN